LDADEPRSVIDMGLSGIGIEATVLPHPTGPCGTRLPSPTWLWGISGGAWSPISGAHIFFEALEDGPRTLTAVYAALDAATLSMLEQEAGRRLLAGFVLKP
jgi:hypothetical protein